MSAVHGINSLRPIIAAEPDGFRSQFTFPGVGPQHGSHAIAVEIDSRSQVVMAIRLNEASDLLICGI